MGVVMTIKRNLALFILGEIMMCTIVTFIVAIGNLNYNIYTIEKIIGVFSTLNFALFFFQLKKNNRDYFSVSTLFVIFMYLFNLGLPISRLFGWIDDTGTRFMARRIYSMGADTFIDYMVYVYWLISMLQIGILYYYGKNTSFVVSDERTDYNYLLKICRKIGSILVFIGIVPYFYNEYIYIHDSLIYGYQNTESASNLSGTGIGLIGNLFMLGTMMWLFAFQKEKKVFDTLFCVLTIYQIFRMYFTGDRSTGIVLILIWLLVRHNFVAAIKGKKAILYAIVIYIAMIFIKMIEITRTFSNLKASEIFHELVQSNIIAETVFAYGGNVWSGIMVYYSVPSSGMFRYGLTYLAAIIGKPLSILKITDVVWQFADFSNFLQEDARGPVVANIRSAMGGSFSGEWYFNFGWIGIAIIPIFGFILAKFSDACVIKTNNPVKSAFLLYVATMVIWWVRQYFSSVAWYTLFYGIVVCITYSLVRVHKKIIV